MLAENFDDHQVLYPVIVQPKLRGVFAAWHPRLGFHTRDLKVWNPAVLAHIQPAGRPCQNYYLTGELYQHGWSQQRINSAVGVNRLGPNEDTAQIDFHVFDCMGPGTVEERWFNLDKDYFNLANYSTPPRYVLPIPRQRAESRQHLDTLYHYYLQEGYEGIIVRQLGSVYSHNYSTAVLKRKPWHDEEATVTGVIEGKKGFRGILGAFIVTRNNLTYKVGSGELTQQLRALYWKHPPLGQQITYRYQDKSDEGIPQQSQFIAIREPGT